MPAGTDIRIGDDERERSAAMLGEHFSAGRLDLAEFETRLDRVYTAKTRGDLDGVLVDLPPAHLSPAAPARSGWRPVPDAMAAWAPWALTGMICLAIWIATSLAAGRPLNFWPFWVIVPWGAVLLVRTQLGLTGGGCGAALRGR